MDKSRVTHKNIRVMCVFLICVLAAQFIFQPIARADQTTVFEIPNQKEVEELEKLLADYERAIIDFKKAKKEFGRAAVTRGEDIQGAVVRAQNKMKAYEDVIARARVVLKKLPPIVTEACSAARRKLLEKLSGEIRAADLRTLEDAAMAKFDAAWAQRIADAEKAMDELTKLVPRADAKCLPETCPVNPTLPNDAAKVRGLYATSDDALIDLERFINPAAPQYNPRNADLIRGALKQQRAALQKNLGRLNRAAYSSEEAFQRAVAEIQYEINAIDDGLKTYGPRIDEGLARCAQCVENTKAAQAAAAATSREVKALQEALRKARAEFFKTAAQKIKFGESAVTAEEIAQLREAMYAAEQKLAERIAAEAGAAEVQAAAAARAARIAARAAEISAKLTGRIGFAAWQAAIRRGLSGVVKGISTVLSKTLEAAGGPIGVAAIETTAAYFEYQQEVARLEELSGLARSLGLIRQQAENNASQIVKLWPDLLNAIEREAQTNACKASGDASWGASDKLLNTLLSWAGELQATNDVFKSTAGFFFLSASDMPDEFKKVFWRMRALQFDEQTQTYSIIMPRDWLGRLYEESNGITEAYEGFGKFNVVGKPDSIKIAFRATALPGGSNPIREALDAVDPRIYKTLFDGNPSGLNEIMQQASDFALLTSCRPELPECVQENGDGGGGAPAGGGSANACFGGDDYSCQPMPGGGFSLAYRDPYYPQPGHPTEWLWAPQSCGNLDGCSYSCSASGQLLAEGSGGCGCAFVNPPTCDQPRAAYGGAAQSGGTTERGGAVTQTTRIGKSLPPSLGAIRLAVRLLTGR